MTEQDQVTAKWAGPEGFSNERSIAVALRLSRELVEQLTEADDANLGNLVRTAATKLLAGGK